MRTTVTIHNNDMAMRAVDDVRQSKMYNLIFTLIGDKNYNAARMVSFKYLYTLSY